MLHIERIPILNALKNYNYLIVNTDTREAIVLDPTDAQRCREVAEKNGWRIAQIVNTHEHMDHICGNDELIKHYGCTLNAPATAKNSIAHVNRWLAHGDTVPLGSLTLHVLNTPGHTFSHICLLIEGETPVLLSGDTLLNAGVGHCYNGDAGVLFTSMQQFILPLPDHTLVYPGHDYIENNLAFAQSREPDNTFIAELLAQVKQQTPDTRTVTTLAIEKMMNPFLRLNSTSIRTKLLETFPEMGRSDQDVFVHLRKLRDQW